MPNPYDLFDQQIGLNAWLQKAPSVIQFPISTDLGYSLSGSEVGGIMAYAKTNFEDTATEGWIQGMDVDGTYKWMMGVSGSSIDWNVTTASTLTVAGSIVATTGTIGGFNIGADYIRDAANSMGLASTVTGGDDVRFWAGAAFASRATAPLRITEAGVLVATSATITGTITATGGAIGGFSIGADYIRDAANSMGLASTVSGSNDVRFWAGDTFANRATAPFRVFEDGSIVATSATITISSIGGFDIGSDYVRDAANSFGLASTVSGSDDVRFFAGDTFANRATAPFRVYESGKIYANTIVATSTADVNIIRGQILYGYSVSDHTQGQNLHTANNLDYYGYLDENTSPDTVYIKRKSGIETVSATALTTIYANAQTNTACAAPVIIDDGSVNACFSYITGQAVQDRIYVLKDITDTTPTWEQVTVSGYSLPTQDATVRLLSDGTNIYFLSITLSTSKMQKFTWNRSSTTLTWDSEITFGSGGDLAVFVALAVYMTDDAVYNIASGQQKKYNLSGTYLNDCEGYYFSGAAYPEPFVIKGDIAFIHPIYQGGSSSASNMWLLHILDGLY